MVPPLRIDDDITVRRADNRSAIGEAVRYADTKADEHFKGSLAYVPEGLIPAAIRADAERLEAFRNHFLGYRVRGVIDVPIPNGGRYSIPLVTLDLNLKTVAPWCNEHLAEREWAINDILDKAPAQGARASGYAYKKGWFQRRQFNYLVLRRPEMFGMADDPASCAAREERFHDPTDIAMRLDIGDDEFLVATNAYRPPSAWIVSLIGGPTFERFIAERNEREQQERLAAQRAVMERKQALTPAWAV